jgi:hypothetical protein
LRYLCCMRLRGFELAGTVSLALIVAAALAAPAVAESSSIDAYGGQAAVLGKPVHRHHHAPGTQPSRGPSTTEEEGASGGAAGVAGAGARAGGGGSGGGAAPGAHGASGHGAGGVAASPRTAAHAGGGPSEPVALSTRSTDGSLSLSGLDVLLLCLLLACLLGAGVLIRRLSSTSS